MPSEAPSPPATAAVAAADASANLPLARALLLSHGVFVAQRCARRKASSFPWRLAAVVWRLVSQAAPSRPLEWHIVSAAARRNAATLAKEAVAGAARTTEGTRSEVTNDRSSTGSMREFCGSLRSDRSYAGSRRARVTGGPRGARREAGGEGGSCGRGEGGERRRVFAVPQNESSWGDNGPEWRSGAGAIGPLSLAGGGDGEALEGNAVAALSGEWAAGRPRVGRGANTRSLFNGVAAASVPEVSSNRLGDTAPAQSSHNRTTPAAATAPHDVM